MIHLKKNLPLWSALYLIVISGLGSQVASAEDKIIEEVVITGSYIKASATDGASPVDVLDRKRNGWGFAR